MTIEPGLQVLIVDNDTAHIRPWVETLSSAGCQVVVASNVREAERVFSEEVFDIAILDVMMPLDEEATSHGFTPEVTDAGRSTGLALFRRLKPRAEGVGCQLSVLTVRSDRGIRQAFLDLGLQPEAFATKSQMRYPEAFLDWIQQLALLRAQDT